MFSITQDLAARSLEQTVEIVCISGPRARQHMELIRDGKLAELSTSISSLCRSEVVVTKEIADRVFARYGKKILAPAPWANL